MAANFSCKKGFKYTKANIKAISDSFYKPDEYAKAFFKREKKETHSPMRALCNSLCALTKKTPKKDKHNVRRKKGT